MKKIPFLSFFGMTKELTALSSYISITDDRAAVIENCKQIVECSEIMAKVLTGSFEIEIWGSGLTMSNFCSDSVEIRGKIESVKLVSRSIRERGFPLAKCVKRTESSLCVCLRNTVRHLKDYAMNLGLNTPPQNVTEALFLQNVFSEEEDLS